MKAIWSFWTKPSQAMRKSIWFSQRHHFYSWVLSVETARQHFPHIALFTDREGAQLLVDKIGLKFDEVSTELEKIAKFDPQWWALGKVWAYRAQTEPFVHIDNDVFLWKPLSSLLTSSALLVQNPDDFIVGNSWYKPDEMEEIIQSVNGWLPKEWQLQRSLGSHQKAFNCGIFGGNRVDFIRYYADLAIQFVEHPANQPAWLLLNPSTERNVLFEQYLLGCCIEYHRQRSDSSFKDIQVQYLFPSLDYALVDENSARAGFTHLLADAKRNRAIAERLENRVKRDYPEYYDRCTRVCEQTFAS